MSRKAEIILEYQNYIETPPVAPERLYAQACSSDGPTMDAWRKTWITNITANKAKFGSFAEYGLGKLHGAHKFQSAIIVGSGPSLKVNAEKLKENPGVTVVSCLHNFHFLEDLGVKVDYYVTLDAGPVVIEEVTEGGTKTPDEYWAMTKDRTLIAFIGTDPKLFEKWQGKVYFYNAPIPDDVYTAEVGKIEQFHTYVSNGGNVLGSCLYIAKGILGCGTIAFMGADFAFGYDKKFHAWESKYDANLGYVLKAVDVYGNKVLTWQSYNNFKSWFDFVAVKVPGVYINCTEGGTFGAYADGNIMAVKQMEILEFFKMYQMHEAIKGQCENPAIKENKILF